MPPTPGPDPRNSLLHHLDPVAQAAAAAAVLLQLVPASFATAAAPPSSALLLPVGKGSVSCHYMII